MMQETGSLFCRARHLKFTNIKSIDRRQINAASRFNLLQHGLDSLRLASHTRKQTPQASVARSAMNLGQQINQKLRLRSVVWRVAVHIKKAQQAVDEVVNRGPDIGRLLSFPIPARQTETIALILLQRRGIKNADDVIAYPHCFNPLLLYPGCLPIKRINILQYREDAISRQSPS